jgi:hypothetical protein
MHDKRESLVVADVAFHQANYLRPQRVIAADRADVREHAAPELSHRRVLHPLGARCSNTAPFSMPSPRGMPKPREATATPLKQAA